MPGAFDVVTCMEMLEHVPDPASIVAACAALARPGGIVVVSTINRNLKAYALAVVAAEYVLGLLPKGTHDYAKFLHAGRGRVVRAPRGPRARGHHRHDLQPVHEDRSGSSPIPGVNYMMAFRRARRMR